MDNFIIVDVSGTNTNFALVVGGEIKKKRHFETNDIVKFSDCISMYMYLEKIDVKKIVISCAGQILRGEVVNLTNSNLRILKRDIELIGFEKVILLNDFEVLPYGVKDINNFLDITPKANNSDFLVIGAGTGFGISYKKDNKVYGTEEGHLKINFDNLNLREEDFISFLKNELKKENIEFEDILSGRGIENIYNYLTQNKLLAKEISDIETKSSFETFEIFYNFYLKAIMYFLKKFDLKQVYIAGGIIMKNQKYFQEKIIEIWRKEIGDNIGCRILLDYDVSLYGLKNYGLENL